MPRVRLLSFPVDVGVHALTSLQTGRVWWPSLGLGPRGLQRALRRYRSGLHGGWTMHAYVCSQRMLALNAC